MAKWTPKLTFGLWGIVQSAVAAGWNMAGVFDAVHAAGAAPDAATLAHLYSRAVGGDFIERAEASYSASVDRETYMNRRPGRPLIANLPKGFKMYAPYRQVVQLHGFDPLTGLAADQYINVQFGRLLSRGDAIDLAIAAGEHYLTGPVTADYVATWRKVAR